MSEYNPSEESVFVKSKEWYEDHSVEDHTKDEITDIMTSTSVIVGILLLSLVVISL